jgi:hypothetical protein
MPIYIVDPRQPLEGCLTLVCNGDEAVNALKNIEQDLKPRRFRVRATIADVVPLIGDLEALLGPRPFPNILLNEDPLQIFLHHGGNNATYYRFVGDDSHLLLYLEVVVESRFPSNALLLGRVAINRMLDSESRNFTLPLVIARLDLLGDDSEMVLASEIVLPYKTKIAFGPLGGLDQMPLFTPWLALLREGATATSPFYRLLCAWRAYDGIQVLRKTIREQAEALGIAERLPKDPELDLTALREAGASEEFLTGIKRASDLFGKLTEMRNGVGHFLLESGAHVYMSDARAYKDYSLASHVLLRAAGQAITDLQHFYGTHIDSQRRIGSVSPDRHRAHEYVVRDPELRGTDATHSGGTGADG